MATREIEQEFYQKQLVKFITDKLESKHFKESLNKVGLVRVKKELDEIKRSFFDLYHDVTKRLNE